VGKVLRSSVIWWSWARGGCKPWGLEKTFKYWVMSVWIGGGRLVEVGS